ncbi:hypothetical protein LguiB_001225 [Lonicera macranthoides]
MASPSTPIGTVNPAGALGNGCVLNLFVGMGKKKHHGQVSILEEKHHLTEKSYLKELPQQTPDVSFKVQLNALEKERPRSPKDQSNDTLQSEQNQQSSHFSTKQTAPVDFAKSKCEDPLDFAKPLCQAILCVKSPERNGRRELKKKWGRVLSSLSPLKSIRNEDIKDLGNWHLWGKDERNG